ncbi:hypothetical protein TCELL_0197 [Thermogladius calderae 1633]|uniref:Uncharacterized protein n=2 Tax=Thermogladius calderae TaxID=1200300 RepID=I3TCY4_THEC1|nr:hypothetical protein TCELL_0197 [Thermogladius calderae 1633]
MKAFYLAASIKMSCLVSYLMTLVAEGLLKRAVEGLSREVEYRAREVVARVLLPERVDGSVVEKYFRKALRHGAWRRLPAHSRGLLLALRRWGVVKSPTLRAVLREVFLEIELYTLRGRALFYGAIVALAEGWGRLGELVSKASRLLTLGIFYLNLPTVYRFYG